MIEQESAAVDADRPARVTRRQDDLCVRHPSPGRERNRILGCLKGRCERWNTPTASPQSGSEQFGKRPVTRSSDCHDPNILLPAIGRMVSASHSPTPSFCMMHAGALQDLIGINAVGRRSRVDSGLSAMSDNRKRHARVLETASMKPDGQEFVHLMTTKKWSSRMSGSPSGSMRPIVFAAS